MEPEVNRKPVFDAVRTLLGRGFRREEVAALDLALNKACCTAVGPPSASFATRSAGPDCLALIRKWERCAKRRADGQFQAYPDPGTGGDPWTIGWGATGPGIGPDTVWTQEQCDARLEADVARFATEVAAVLDGAPTTQSQFDALVSFHYNTGAIARATLTARHRASDHAAAQAEFGKWVNAGGRPLAGLRKRRADEAVLYAGRTRPV